MDGIEDLIVALAQRFDKNNHTGMFVSMAIAHHRKKNPAQVRTQLIENATRLALEQGLAAVSVEAVARAAGVTRGGLFHHFPNKQALVDAVFAHLLGDFTAALEARIAVDDVAYGRFTRAYVELVFAQDENADWIAMWLSTVTDPQMRNAWGRWLDGQLQRHRETDGDTVLEAVRFAADGVWAGLACNTLPRDRNALRHHLLAMTKDRP